MKQALLAITWLALGILAGFLLLVCSAFILMTVAPNPGFDIEYAPYAAILIWLIGTLFIVIRKRKRDAIFKPRLFFFLAGIIMLELFWKFWPR
jgi:hypothetical protein